MNENIVYDFAWDPAKALSNARKHGITFDQAATVLLDALALTVYDDASSRHEERWVHARIRCWRQPPRSVAYLRDHGAGQYPDPHHLGPQGDQTRTTQL